MISHKRLWILIFGLLLVGCTTTGNSVAPVSQYVLSERSLQSELIPGNLWTVSFDYEFPAQASSGSPGFLSMESAFTLLNPDVKRVRVLIIFVDADNKVLGETTFLELNSFPTNPLITNHQFSTPPGTVAIAFRGRTSGGWPFLD